MTDAPTTDTPEAPPVDSPPAQAPETDWKSEARKWEQRAKENKARLDEAEPIVSQWRQLEEASKSELQRAQEELGRWQTEAEKWRTASVASTITAIASTDFADPSDAATALADPAKYLDAGGQINEDAIRADLAAVLERKPHWRRQGDAPTPRIPAPNPHQGSGGGNPVANPATELAAILQGQLNGSR